MARGTFFGNMPMFFDTLQGASVTRCVTCCYFTGAPCRVILYTSAAGRLRTCSAGAMDDASAAAPPVPVFLPGPTSDISEK
jgi:hypothetical protein